jgi:hypothetical protein
MDNTLEHFDPASEAFALIVESHEAAGLSLESAIAPDAFADDESAWY